MSNQKKCEHCGSEMNEQALEGLCPRCLLARNLDTQTMPDGETVQLANPLSIAEMRQHFPQFEILEYLGRGGMGVVYKARQKTLERDVAIKVLAGEIQGDTAFAERFSKEAKILAQMSHPNIVTVHDFGETHGLYYIVMEYVDGVNLRALLSESRLTPEQALKIVPPVCEALEYAHAKNIVHRDIKPENLLLDQDGRIKIADFGIASLVGASGENSGTPPYKAPEQGVDHHVDHRADIYALGVVLYEMLTGEKPGTSFAPPSQKVEVDIRLDDIVMRAMSSEPERRYRSASDFRTVVQTIKPTESDFIKPQRAKFLDETTIQKILKAAGIALIVLGSLNAALSVLTSLISPIMGQRITGLGGLPIPPSFSPGVLDISILVFGYLIYSLSASTLTIIGGKHLFSRTSRTWALIGAGACCLIPRFSPLGLILGLGIIAILLIYDQKETGFQDPQTRPTPDRQLSIMAVVSASLAAVSFIGLLFLLGFLA